MKGDHDMASWGALKGYVRAKQAIEGPRFNQNGVEVDQNVCYRQLSMIGSDGREYSCKLTVSVRHHIQCVQK